jgi:hypothetical protein
MLPIMACPACSSPRAKVFARPTCYPGRGTGKWLLVPGGGCECFSVWDDWNNKPDADELVTAWNKRAEAKAAELSAARNHTAEQAADFLASLRPKSWQDGF